MPSQFNTADLSDSNDVQLIKRSFHAYGLIQKFCGQIQTVSCPNDNSKVKEMLNSNGAGKVLVVDADGFMWQSMVGDNIAQAAIDNDWRGIIVNGVIRDSDQINTMPIGIKALGTTPVKTAKQDLGQINVPLYFGQCRIEPEQWIYADNDGVIISPHNLLPL